jgi:predicted secreted protein with PEFG-CTERM motif
MKIVFISSIFFLIFLTPLGMNLSFAQTTHIINIPTGAASPDAPYFWQSEMDGDTTGDIQIKALESIRWENADTAAHTVTSGTAEDGPDGIFDSSLFPPGGDFQWQFIEVGEFDYFCLVHPWMTGTVTVMSGLQVIPKIGSDAGDGATTFDVEYQFNRVISSVSVNEDQKSITFEIVGTPKGLDNTLTLMLPKNLINGPLVVWADGQQISNSVFTEGGEINSLEIPLKRDSQRVTIVGTTVVPEFGTIATAILAVGIFSLIAMTFKSQKFMMLNGRL